MTTIKDESQKRLCEHINNRECSLGGSAKCKGTGWENPEECIIYQLIEDNKKLKERVRKLELSVNGVSTATTTTQ